MTPPSRRDFLKTTVGAYATGMFAMPAQRGGASSPTPDDLAALSLSDAAELLRGRKASAVELTNACLAQIERLNPVLNAFITVTAEQALVDARAAESEIARGRRRGPLHGIPIALKDLFDTAGVKTTAGSAVFADSVHSKEAEVVHRLKQAGAGKVSNLHRLVVAYST